jgi:hypothetical protein
METTIDAMDSASSAMEATGAAASAGKNSDASTIESSVAQACYVAASMPSSDVHYIDINKRQQTADSIPVNEHGAGVAGVVGKRYPSTS